MAKQVLLYFILIICLIVDINAENETISVEIPDEPGIDLLDINNTNVLRYGHHLTHDCQIFHKAYICIMKCLELAYDIAKSDKNCRCTCFKDPVKKTYFRNMTQSWKVPTTSLPPWAYDQLKLSTTGSDEDYFQGSLMYEIQNTTNSTEGSNEAKDSKEIADGSKENSTSTENESNEEGASSGEKEALSGEKGASSGEKGASSGEKGASSGEKGASSGEKGASSGEKGASSGEKGASSGEKGATVEANSAEVEESSTGEENVTADESAPQGESSPHDEGGESVSTTEGIVPAAEDAE